MALGNDNAEKIVLFAERHHQYGSHAAFLESGASHRISRQQRCELGQVTDVDEGLLAPYEYVGRIAWMQSVRLFRYRPSKPVGHSSRSNRAEKFAVESEKIPARGTTEGVCLVQYRFEQRGSRAVSRPADGEEARAEGQRAQYRLSADL